MHVAISHDWLANPRGAERVLEEFCRTLPQVSIYTLFCEPGSVGDSLRRHSLFVSSMNRIPGVSRHYRYLLPLFGRAVREFLIDDADLLLSISHSVAKAIPRAPGIPHICYCLTPPRYLWEPQLYGRFLQHSFKRRLVDWFSMDLMRQDLEANRSVDQFVAISRTIRDRIRKHYQRDAEVIYPCIDLDFFHPLDLPRQDFYLIVSALVPQKRIELAVEAFNRNGRPLRIVGSGPLMRSLRRQARENVQFLGWQPDSCLRELYGTARGLIFPGSEDFGLVPVEAQACGCPVIAYRHGGLLETVIEGETGLFFPVDDAAALVGAIADFERSDWDSERAVLNARRFSRETFLSQWRALLDRMGLEFPEAAA